MADWVAGVIRMVVDGWEISWFGWLGLVRTSTVRSSNGWFVAPFVCILEGGRTESERFACFL